MVKGQSKSQCTALSQFLYSWPLHGRPLGFVCNGIEILVDGAGALDVEHVGTSFQSTKAGSLYLDEFPDGVPVGMHVESLDATLSDCLGNLSTCNHSPTGP